MSSGPWVVSTSTFRWFALADLVATIAITLSGAAVRLTGSGLGCSDWPACTGTRLTGPDGYHSIIEFGNRLVTVAIVLIVGISFVAATLRRPRRTDLIVLNGVLIAGIVADALLGALVVYSKLNAWLVSLHLVISLSLVASAATLYHRSKFCYDSRDTVGSDVQIRRLSRFIWIPLGAVIFAGTVTTGSGPHAGESTHQLVAKRLPIAFSTATWIHAISALVFIGVVLGLLIFSWRRAAPPPTKRNIQHLAILSVAQGAVGFIQYVTHVPAVLVEIHILLVVSLVIGVTYLNVGLVARERETEMIHSS